MKKNKTINNNFGAINKRFEAFFKKKLSYRIPKQSTSHPYSELKRAHNKR